MMVNNFSQSINHIHGSLKNDIVFGIDDKADVKQEYVYLYKAFDQNRTKINTNQILENHDEIVFYGYSLGETDTVYFDDFFKKRCEYNELHKNKQKKITFYYYGEQGYKDLYYRLIILTNRNVSKLIQYNNVTFIDASI
jgi:hypothetical protein